LKIYAPRICGAVLVVIGVVWFGRGVGAIGGSFMSGRPVWAAVGAVCFVVGVALLAWGTAVRRRQVDGALDAEAGGAVAGQAEAGRAGEADGAAD